MTSHTSMPAVHEHCELVDQRDVDRTEDVVQELRQLGDSGVETGTRWSQIGRWTFSAAFMHAAVSPPTTFGVVRSVKSVRPGSTRSGEKASAKSPPATRPGLLEQRHEVLARRAGKGRGIQDHRLTTADHPGQSPRGAQQGTQVGLAVGVERRRNADKDRVALMELDEAGRSPNPPVDGPEPVIRDVLDVRLPSAYPRHLAGIRVDADHVESRLGEGDRQRKSDVPQSDDPDAHRNLSADAVLRTSGSVATAKGEPADRGGEADQPGAGADREHAAERAVT